MWQALVLGGLFIAFLAISAWAEADDTPRTRCGQCGRPIDYAHIPRDVRELGELGGMPKPVWYVGPLVCPRVDGDRIGRQFDEIPPGPGDEPTPAISRKAE